jgi:peptidoglycan/xylan/chitin deacetylase (PgdA/CDA1 family)
LTMLGGIPGVILLYHRIAVDPEDPFGLCISPEKFNDQMAFIRAHCSPMALEDLVTAARCQSLPTRAVAIAFDDGYLDNLTTASPILENFKLPASFFVTTRHFGGEPEPYWWDLVARSPYRDDTGVHRALQAADVDTREGIIHSLSCPDIATRDLPRPMTASEVLKLGNRARHAIAAHTHNHLDLTSQAHHTVVSEMTACKAALERLLDRDIRSVAYPYGACDRTVATAASVVGFGFGAGVGNVPVGPETDPLLIPRVEVTPSMDLAGFLTTLNLGLQ